MSNIIYPHALANGQIVDLAKIMANFNEASGVVNGGLDGANLGAASVGNSKLTTPYYHVPLDFQIMIPTALPWAGLVMADFNGYTRDLGRITISSSIVGGYIYRVEAYINSGNVLGLAKLLALYGPGGVQVPSSPMILDALGVSQTLAPFKAVAGGESYTIRANSWLGGDTPISITYRAWMYIPLLGAP